MSTIHAYTMEKFVDLVNAYFYLLEDYSTKDYYAITSEIRNYIKANKSRQDFNQTLGDLIVKKLNECIVLLNNLGFNYDQVVWNAHEINNFTCIAFMNLYHHR